MGPSGSGKTTFLNFLAGRLLSDNLVLEGEYRFNGQTIKTIEPFSDQIGYVMQEDALLATLTPRECMQFAADLKLRMKEEDRADRSTRPLPCRSCSCAGASQKREGRSSRRSISPLRSCSRSSTG